MRKFSSYGSPDKELHYYAPRTALIERAYHQLLGEDLNKGGNYLTVWAPRQSGKTWVMQQVTDRLKERDDFEVALLTLQSANGLESDAEVLKLLVSQLSRWFNREFPEIQTWAGLWELFAPPNFNKPLILILDEFDALEERFINKFSNEFRSIYTSRQNESDKKKL